MVSMLVILQSGCAVRMLREGWAIHYDTLVSRKSAGYQEPVATRNTRGDVTLQYDARVTRYGVLGPGFEERVSFKRMTNSVSHKELKPVNDLLILNANHVFPDARKNYPPAEGRNAYVYPGGFLPREHFKREPNNLNPKSISYPARECILWEREWIWYVPPQSTNDVPKAAMLTTEKTRTPSYLWPAKIALFPVFLAADIICDPVCFLLSLHGE